MRGYFITGTDTNVGKTYVTCTLARRAVALGHRVFAFKPIETGCSPSPSGDLVGADQEALALAAGDWQHGPLRGLYRFPLPAAPSVAAFAFGAPPIDISIIASTSASVASSSTLTLVEGAGGWRVPVTDTADMSDLARAVSLPVILVARSGLGTINHTLLSIEAILRDGLPLAAVIMSQLPSEPMPSSNRAEIQRRWAGPVLVLREDPTSLDSLLR